ncbi:hypothetical protein AB0451_14615 [Streptomyces sp. NPDC052000]|uniref:hypothetical protein n=1 Tax=Streptomyces sp. NPDC052000 TaxID=3155676 RepID=UPI00344BEBB9
MPTTAGTAHTSRIRHELARLDGQVPFRAVHDWHARTVVPILVEASARGDEGAGLQEAVGQLHARALAGERIDAAVWTAALEPALREVYRRAYPYAEAHATASANAHAYAMANDYGAAVAHALAGARAFAAADPAA